MTECLWCGQEVREVRYMTDLVALADWSGSYECPGRTLTPSPHGAHEAQQLHSGGK